MSIVVAILIFGLIVLIHELGHFLLARRAGILVETFSIGMGPKILKKKIGETQWCVSIIPFGGYCQMLGEDAPVKDDERSFSNKTVWERFLVIIAGPMFNFILAFIFAIVYVALSGIVPTTVSTVEDNSPAMEAGILAGDKIIGYNGKHIVAQRELSLYMNNELPEIVELEVKRDGEKMTFIIKPFFDEENRYRVGIGFEGSIDNSVFDIIKYAGIEVILWVKIVIYSLAQLISGNFSPKEVSGPIGIVNIVGDSYKESVQYGFGNVMATLSGIIVLLSSNLGVMNLLPIPALDGGRLVFILIEAVRGKPVDPDKEGFVHFIGFVLLMGLMVLILFNDIKNLIF